MYSIHIYTDGKAAPNPGVATAGFAAQLKNDSTTVDELQGMLKLTGKCTNNDAEYQAAILALNVISKPPEGVITSGKESEWLEAESLTLYTDSELMFTQNVLKARLYTGRPRKRKVGDRAPKKNSLWAAKTYNSRLRDHKRSLSNAMYGLKLRDKQICLVPRELNIEADLLTNIAMDTLSEGAILLHNGRIATVTPETLATKAFNNTRGINNASI